MLNSLKKILCRTVAGVKARIVRFQKGVVLPHDTLTAMATEAAKQDEEFYVRY